MPPPTNYVGISRGEWSQAIGVLKPSQVIIDLNVLPGLKVARLELRAERERVEKRGGGEGWEGNLEDRVG